MEHLLQDYTVKCIIFSVTERLVVCRVFQCIILSKGVFND